MNFVHILGKIGHGLGVGLHVAEVAGAVSAPIVSTFDPTAGALITMFDRAIFRAESIYTEAGKGSDKKQLFMDEIGNGIQVGLAVAGKNPNDPALVQPILDHASKYADMAVASFNSIAAILQMFQHPATAQAAPAPVAPPAAV